MIITVNDAKKGGSPERAYVRCSIHIDRPSRRLRNGILSFEGDRPESIGSNGVRRARLPLLCTVAIRSARRPSRLMNVPIKNTSYKRDISVNHAVGAGPPRLASTIRAAMPWW